jgi:hypothetical protein
MNKMISITYHSFFKNFFRFVLVATLVIGPMQNAYSWDLLEENNEFAGVRTHFNPAFGPFEVFFPDDGTQRAQDLLDLGFFGLYIECDTGEKRVGINYQLWNDKDRQWLAQPLAPVKRVNIKFGNSKPMSWNVSNSEWWPDGSKTAYRVLIFNNPTLFVKKINSVSSISLTVNANQEDYQLRFITKNLKKYNSYFKNSGCQ